MVHQNQTRFVLANQFHSFLCISNTATSQIKNRQNADQGSPKNIGFYRLSPFGTGLRHGNIIVDGLKCIFQ
jgi:hypothetical protein